MGKLNRSTYLNHKLHNIEENFILGKIDHGHVDKRFCEENQSTKVNITDSASDKNKRINKDTNCCEN